MRRIFRRQRLQEAFPINRTQPRDKTPRILGCHRFHRRHQRVRVWYREIEKVLDFAQLLLFD